MEEFEGGEEERPIQLVKSFGDIKFKAEGTFVELGIQFLIKLKGQTRVMLDVPTLDESSLVRENQISNDFGEPGGKDFGEDFVSEV